MKTFPKTGAFGHALRRLTVAAGLSLIAATAAAQGAFPSQPITLVVGFPPGGSNDIVARIVAPKVSSILGVPVVVENRAGANATIGTDSVVRAKPDGYTITLGSASPMAISPHTYSKLPYNPVKDLRTITTVAQTPELIAVNPSVPAKTLAEIVDLSKKQELTFSSSGAGGLPHLAIELLKTESGGKVVHVPYKGASPAVTDAAGGHVSGVIMDLPALKAMVEAKKLVPIAVTHTERSNVMPDVPTSIEAGLPNVLAFNWFAIMAPAKTPDDVVNTLHAAFVKAAHDPEVVKQLGEAGITPFTQASPAEAHKFLEAETERWGKVARAANVKAD
jgi:Uncharacterized protein conserved in bacteria